MNRLKTDYTKFKSGLKALAGGLAFLSVVTISNAVFAADDQPENMAVANLQEAIELHTRTLGITSIDLSYRFFGGGMEVFSLDTQAILTPRTYEIASQIKTQGIADSLFKGLLLTQARGQLTESGPQLNAYSQDYRGSYGEQSVFMARDPNKGYTVLAIPRNGIHAQPDLPANILDGTVDPLTASIYTALNATEEPCKGKISIFDGRRIFDLKFKKDGDDHIDASRVGGYKGEVQRCKVDFKPVAGYARKWLLAEARNPMKPFTVWIAELEGSQGKVLDKPLVIPVKLLIQTRFMHATAHLTQATIDGRTIINAKLR